MEVKIDYKESFNGIDQMISRLPQVLVSQEETVLRRAGTIVKKRLQYYLYRSDVEQQAKKKAPANRDGSRPYIHVKEDVVSSVRKDKHGNLYVSIRGGKLTGYKWHLINDGHVARDRSTWVPGTHFMDKAINSSYAEIEKLINDMLKKVAE